MVGDATFKGRPCIKCGSTDRYRKTKACARCAVVGAKAYRMANPEYTRLSAKDRYEIAWEKKNVLNR